jgi:hypothetical protein
LTLAIAAVLAPVQAGATDSDLKHTYAFKVAADNGYSIFVIAASERADGKGKAVLFVGRGDGGAVYDAPATVTATRIEADLGGLGAIALDVVPSGRQVKLRSRCADERPHRRSPVTYEPPLYRGNFEFHGEEGFTAAAAAPPRDYSQFFLEVLCGAVSSGEFGGAGVPGARLRLRSHRGSSRLDLQANKNHPGAGTRFAVEVHERRGGVGITRSRTLWVGAAAFDYDPLLRLATLAPPAPFSGRAIFRRDAATANRWSGNLTVDLPGRSKVPLTGARVQATLVRSCWQGEGRGSRADCGF